MAGRSRSMEAVIACLYLDPEWLENARISDVANEALQENLGDVLKRHLDDPYGPLPSDIAEYVKLKRPEATALSKLGANRTGFLGLMTLNQEISKFRKEPLLIEKMPEDRLKRVAQNIGLMLQAPLDIGFRDKKDINEQKEDFVEMYKIYANKKGMSLNLLEQMLIPIDKDDMGYKQNFEALSPSAKAHFAILAAKVGAGASKLPAPYSTPELCALEALREVKKLSVGDQIELLREFGSKESFTFESVAKQIVSGSKLDKYHAGIQLSELYSIANKVHDEAAMEKISRLADSKLSKAEKKSYAQQQQLHKPLPALPPGWALAKQKKEEDHLKFKL
jgi:hypothetical protein